MPLLQRGRRNRSWRPVESVRKTVVLGAAGRQRVLSAVVNAHPAVPRPERDVLRAILHNYVVQAGSVRPGLVPGRVPPAHARPGEVRRQLAPPHGRRLRAIADQIDWG
jgi:hypothetical protein